MGVTPILGNSAPLSETADCCVECSNRAARGSLPRQFALGESERWRTSARPVEDERSADRSGSG